MADKKSRRGAKDRRRVSASEGYEVAYFARKHGITAAETRALFAKVGYDREKLNAAADWMKKSLRMPPGVRPPPAKK
jgi:hypothetical protein